MGAWIETNVLLYGNSVEGVAPRVGAWIETDKNNVYITRQESRPVWARGLKP